jgi:predicted SAM-dependent methyltransferase
VVEKLRVILGAGEQHWPGWIATQQCDLNLTDPQSFARYFGEQRADALLCEHVWEHLTLEQGRVAASLCFSYLRPGGFLRVAVPDANVPDPDYQRLVQVGGPRPADHPAAGHRIVYDLRTLADVFESAGFKVNPLEYHDEDGRFQTHPWSAEDGPIYRSSLMDRRNAAFRAGMGKPGFLSLILDARKPPEDAYLSALNA